MTRAQFLRRTQLQLELAAAQLMVRNVLGMVRQGLSAEDIADCVEFCAERNAEAVVEGLRQVEQLLDRHLRGVDNGADTGWLKQLLDIEVERYDGSTSPQRQD